MAKKLKGKKYEEINQKADLELKRQDLKRSKQNMNFDQESNGRSRKAEKRAEAKELREVEDQQFKRQEESRRQSADTREEIMLLVKILAAASGFGLAAIRYKLVSALVASIISWTLLSLFAGIIAFAISRLVVKLVKRLKGKK